MFFQHKCGSKRKNHKCGLGLCSAKSGESSDGMLPKKRRLKGPYFKTEEAVIIDLPEKCKISEGEIPNCKICSKCGRPIKGHQLPKGKRCILEPLPLISLEKCKTSETDGGKIQDSKTCNKCGRLIKGHPIPKGKKCILEPLPFIKEILLEKESVKLEKNRLRQKSLKALADARIRNEATEARVKKVARCKAARKKKRKSKHYFGWMNNDQNNSTEKHILPNMTDICIDCGAKMFPWERSKMKQDKGKTFSLCCSYGAIRLTLFKDPSPTLKQLFDKTTSESKQFLENIRKYNGLVSMSSRNISGKLTDFSKLKSRGPNIYKMSGQMYHLVPNLLPEAGKKSKFSQIYVFDNESEEQELDERLKHVKVKDKKRIKRGTLKAIQEELKKINPYVAVFKNAAKIFHESPEKQLKMVIKAKGSIGAKKRKQNPSVQDVVVVAPGEQTEPRDVVLYRTQADHPGRNDTVHIDENHYMYDPSAYPLILPFGDDGFSIDHSYEKKKLTALEFYRYHMQVRCGFNTLLKSRRLYQEWLCDMWSKIEGSRLKFIKHNQDQLRVDQYIGLQDALSNVSTKLDKTLPKTEEAKIGQMIILPATFTSSPRYMYSHYLDALAIAREFRKFTLFITMTGNPKWSVVQDNLFEGQQAFDRPDVMNRVFYKMLQDLLTDLKMGALGPLKAWLYTVEGQMRCLKHAHILILLSIQLNVEDIDEIISAQIPDPDEKPELYACVSQYMLHGPCGPAYPNAPCMENGVCSKGYPKDFQEETKLPNDGHGYPIYSRPNNGRVIEKNGFLFDNRWVVPHNEYLLVKFDCHTNVEFIGSFTTIKYVYKYVHKGVDVSTIGIEEINDKDEVTRFINARTIDPYDAHWRISEYRIQERFPAVQKLAIHTEGQNHVIFREGQALKAIEEVKDTTLMAYFKLNQDDHEARGHKYQDIPKYYTWNENKWSRRKTQPEDGDVPRTIGRINNVSPVQGERFYLRLLLNHTTGAESFDELKIFQGETFSTYKETCLAMGLLEDDSEWIYSLEEVSKCGTAKQLRSTFAVILQYCRPTEPRKMFEMFLDSMSDDFIFQIIKDQNCTRDLVDEKTVMNFVLLALDQELRQMGCSITDFKDMPQPVALSEEEKEARIIQDELYKTSKQNAFVQIWMPLLNTTQSNICEEVYKAVHSSADEMSPKIHIINSPGGYGKTLVLKVLAAKIRSEGGIVICVASTGLAAQNLEGGRTAHSRFKIPIDILEDSTCSIKSQSSLAKLIRISKLIIWDEVFSCHRFNIEALERTLRDILISDQAFGGKVICFSGDPRQTLPVVRRGGRAQIVRACIQMSPLYSMMKEHKLTQNMRTDPEEVTFSDYILKIGNGKEDILSDVGENIIEIPQSYLVKTLEQLIDATFPELDLGCDNITDGCIYTPLNKDVCNINDICIKKFPGELKTYLSADSILEEDHKEAVPNEYLNVMNPSGISNHQLSLKIGAPVMLLRNLQAGPKISLRNGTRMIVIQMMERAIEVEVAVGMNKGLRVFLPRVPQYDKSGDYPFTLVRRQYPVRLAFCVTINKGQGQENERVGLDLPAPVFSHGQLYTGMSRGKRGSMVKLRIADNDEGLTENIVYPELLN